MQRSTPTLRRSAAVLFATALLLAGCGTSGGDDDAKKDTTTTAAPDDNTTTTAGDDTTTTEGDSSDAPTTADLEALLPTASDIGDGWKVAASDSDDGDTTLSDAIDEQCPAISELGGGDDDDSDKAKVEFGNDLAQNLAVSLSPSADALDPADLTAGVEAINACDPVTVTDDTTGLTTTVQFQAEEYADLGDQGLRVQGAVTLESDQIPAPVEFLLSILTYRSGTIGVTVQGSDGIDNDTLAVSTLDPQEVMTVGEALAPKVAELSKD